MTDQTSERTTEDTARAAQKFLENIGANMIALDISPKLAVNLFGFFARSVVAAEVEDGADEPDMMMQVFGAFAQGLGLKTEMARVDGDEAEQLKAAFERNSNDHPLQ